MIKLIKNELIKLFHKKSLYILIAIIFAFTILFNLLYKYAFNSYYYSVGDKYYYEDLETRLSDLDINNPNQNNEYIQTKSELDMYNLTKNYDDKSWQSFVIIRYGHMYIYNYNYVSYTIDKIDNEYKDKMISEYNKFIGRLNSDDWQSFVKDERSGYESELKSINNEISLTTDKYKLKELNNQKARLTISTQICDYRLTKDISYGNDYLNTAIENYEMSSNELIHYSLTDHMSKVNRQNILISKYRSEYIIQNKVDLNEMNLSTILMDLYSQSEIFIILFIVVLVGAIVSEEFNKGTIKSLLVKPYTRTKILLSKYITSIIIILMVIFMVFLFNMIIGGILFGFDSLNIPYVTYNFNTESVVKLNVFYYLLLLTIYKLPLFILIMTLAFGISTILTNTGAAIALTLITYFSGSIISQIGAYYNFMIINYLPMTNWNLEQFMFNAISLNKNLTFGFSLSMCIIYLILMIIPTFIIFKKRNIKNI